MAERVRVHYSIDENVAQLFARLAPHRQMSNIIEGLVARWCKDNMSKFSKDNDREIKKLGTVVNHVAGTSEK